MILKRLLSGLLLSGFIFLPVSVLAASVKVTEAVARAVPAVQKNSAVFFALKNTGDKTIRLVSVDSEVAARVELHGHEMEGDMMRMFKLEHGIQLPVGKEVKLQSGGDHVMLMGLKEPLKAGATVHLTLHFSDGDAVDIKVPVKDLRHQKGDAAHGHGHSHNHTKHHH